MSKAIINEVPRYFVPYTNDCFQNAYGALVSFLELNPKLILADYLSFMYDSENGYIGTNYLHKPSTSFDFTEEELNTSLEYVYFPAITEYSKKIEAVGKVEKNVLPVSLDKIRIAMYIEKDSEAAHTRLKELLDKGMPVITVVDLYYCRYHQAYLKNHGAHAVVVTSCDDNAGYVELFDKYTLANSDFDGRLPIEEFKLARSSENSMGLYSKPIRNMWMEVGRDSSFQYNAARWQAIITESCKRMRGQKEVLGRSCGLEELECFRKSLLRKYHENPEESFLIFKFYYNTAFRIMSRSRQRFSIFLNEISGSLPEAAVKEVLQRLTDSSREWEIIAGLALRLAAQKQQSVLENICRHLSLIKEHEESAVEALSAIVAGGF